MESNHIKLLKQLKSSWNNLDIKYVEPFLSEDMVYESQWVFISLEGKLKVLEFLSLKFQAIKELMKTKFVLTNAVIGHIPSMDMRPCILLSQIIGEGLIQSTVLIEERDLLISRIDVCFIPHPSEVKIGFSSSDKNSL